MFFRVPMLSASACDSAVAGVLAHRAHWVQRGPSEFYTLGAASYLDAEPGYNQHASELNPVLREAFAPLYRELAGRLETALGEPVRYADEKALPGFHLWGVPGIPTGPVASLHFDLQYLRLSWPPDAHRDTRRSLSFTLPLQLPRLGGGLTTWDTTYERVNAFYARTGFAGTLADLAALITERVEPYTRGELVVHSGHLLHRIAPVPEVAPDDLRVTLQGHGLYFAGAWQLYW